MNRVIDTSDSSNIEKIKSVSTFIELMVLFISFLLLSLSFGLRKYYLLSIISFGVSYYYSYRLAKEYMC